MYVDEENYSILQHHWIDLFTLPGSVSRPQFLSIGAILVAFYGRKVGITHVDWFVACRVLLRPSLKLFPISAQPGLTDSRGRMVGSCLLVESSCITRCIVRVAHDIVSEDIEAMSNVFVRDSL